MHFNMDKNARMTTWKKTHHVQFLMLNAFLQLIHLTMKTKSILLLLENLQVWKKKIKLRFLTMFTNDNTKFKPCTITRLPIVAATVLGGSESRSLHTRTPRTGKARHYHCVTEFQIMTSRHHAMKNFHANPVFCLRKTTQWISGSLHVKFQACFLSHLQLATWSVPIQITKVPSEFHHKCSSIPSNQNPPVEPFFFGTVPTKIQGHHAPTRWTTVFPPLTGDLGGDDDGLRRQEGHGIHFLLRDDWSWSDGIRREDLLRFHGT